MLILLAMPDPPELRRGYRYTCARDQRRDAEVIKRDLATAYVAHRRQEWADGDISTIVSVRRLRIVRRA
jgi:hypothetical protein